MVTLIDLKSIRIMHHGDHKVQNLPSISARKYISGHVPWAINEKFNSEMTISGKKG